MATLETYFVVLVNDDGSFSTSATIPEEELTATRPANNADVYTVAKQIVTEVDAQLLTDRITNSILRALSAPVEPTQADKIAEALQNRTIETDVTPATEETA